MPAGLPMMRLDKLFPVSYQPLAHSPQPSSEKVTAHDGIVDGKNRWSHCRIESRDFGASPQHGEPRVGSQHHARPPLSRLHGAQVGDGVSPQGVVGTATDSLQADQVLSRDRANDRATDGRSRRG